MCNTSWCDHWHVQIIKIFCSPDLEYLIWADTIMALKELYRAISEQESLHPGDAFITIRVLKKQI